MRHHSGLRLFSSICLAALATAGAANDGRFVDRTTDSGLIATSDISQVNPILGGGAVGDVNGDGWQDVFFPAGGNGADKLFINDGDGTFTDRAAEWNVDVEHLSASAAMADYNGDGLLDIYVLSFGEVGNQQPGHHRLYRNVGGSFVEVAESAGVATTTTNVADGWSATWGDYDRDGDLDLAVAGYRQEPDSNRLFRNDGDGTFTDVTESVGLAGLDQVAGFTPRFADMDGDHDPELIWIGDFSTSKYYVNDGDGTFTDWTPQSGTSQRDSEMGVAIADWNRDGRFDIYVSLIGNDNFYVNQGGNVFDHRYDEDGLVQTGWAWGVSSLDFDNDSWQDIIVASQSQRCFAFRNLGGEPVQFEEVGNALMFKAGDDGRGLAELDADNDGDQDLIVFSSGSPIHYYENRVPPAGNGWLKVTLSRGAQTDIAPHGIGATVYALVDGRVLADRVLGGNNYMSHGELLAHIGLGEVQVIDELRVEWPNGHLTRLYDVHRNQHLEISAGAVFRDAFE